MDIEIEIILTPSYYRELYGEWLTFRSKFRKWQVHVGLLLLVPAYVFVEMSGPRIKDLWIFPCFFILAGVYEVGSFYYSRWQWLKSRADNRLLNQTITLVFESEVIRHSGPFSHGELKWEGIKHIKETAKGLFLIPENGISIYLPKQAFHSLSQVQKVVERFNQVSQPQKTT